MASSYPGALDVLTNPTSVSGMVALGHAAQHAAINDAMEAVQTELGLTPSGSRSTVKTRLDSIDSDVVVLSARGVAPTTGKKEAYRVLGARTLAGLRLSLEVAQTSGTVITIDVKKNGVSVLTTKVTIDNTELTSTTASTAVVIEATLASFADDDEISFWVDAVGDGTARELKARAIWG